MFLLSWPTVKYYRVLSSSQGYGNHCETRIEKGCGGGVTIHGDEDKQAPRLTRFELREAGSQPHPNLCQQVI